MADQGRMFSGRDALDQQIHDYIDHVIVPDRFRHCCRMWFENNKRKYEMAGHGMTEVSDQTEDSPFEHIHRSGKKMCFLKIWTDPDGRYGAKDFSALDEQSMKMNPFYDNDYFLFSIHRFRDSMWEVSKRYDNVHLIEARYLSI